MDKDTKFILELLETFVKSGFEDYTVGEMIAHINDETRKTESEKKMIIKAEISTLRGIRTRMFIGTRKDVEGYINRFYPTNLKVEYTEYENTEVLMRSVRSLYGNEIKNL